MRIAQPNARAYTLVELVLSMTIMTLLMGGLGSAIVIANRAIPDPNSTTAATLDGYYATEQIAADLYVAQSFTVRTPTTVEFTVADRNHGEPGPELIRYEWSGTEGDPLTLQYNANPPTDVVPEVYDFDLTYGLTTKSETTIEEGTVWTEAAPMAYFDGWTGITKDPKAHTLGPAFWVSQYFEVIVPDGTTELKFVRATIMANYVVSPPQAVQVAIHRSKGDGTYEPQSTPIGTPASIPGTTLSTTPFWKEAVFSDVVVKDVGRMDYCLVVTLLGTMPAQVQYLYGKSAPDDRIYLRWTDDGGASWEPRANQLNEQDLCFFVYGSYATTGEEEITTERYFLTSARLTLRVGDDAATRVETSIRILNAPEVMSP